MASFLGVDLSKETFHARCAHVSSLVVRDECADTAAAASAEDVEGGGACNARWCYDLDGHM